MEATRFQSTYVARLFLSLGHFAVITLEKKYSFLGHSRHAWLVFLQDIVPLGCKSEVHFTILISESEHESSVLLLHYLQHLHQDRQDVEVRHIGPNLAFEEDENEINAIAIS